MDTRKAISAKPGVQLHNKSIEDSNTFVTYQIEEETGTLIETAISPNKNHVMARVVSSQHNTTSDCQRSGLKYDEKPGVYAPTQYEHTPASYHTRDVYPPANIVNTPFIILGKEFRHPKVNARLADHPLSDTEIDQRRHRLAAIDYVRDHHRSEGTSSRDHKSSVGSGDFKTPKHSRAARPKDITDSSKSHKHSSTKSNGSDSNMLSGKSARKVKPTKFTTRIKDKIDTIYKDSDKKQKRFPLSDPGDGELRGQGPTDRHVLSTLLITVPRTTNTDSSQASQDKTDKRQAQQKHKRHQQTHMLPRHGSLDSMVYASPRYQNNLARWNMAFDPTNNYRHIAYIGDDGRMYYQDLAEFYPYSDNYWMYPNFGCYNGTNIVPGHGGLKAITTPRDVTSDEEAEHITKRQIKRQIKTHARMLDQTRSDTFRQNKPLKRDLRKTVPLNKYTTPRSKAHKHDVHRYVSANKAGNGRSVKERSSNFTDDLKAREKGHKDNYSDQSTSEDTSQKNTSSSSQKDLTKLTHKDKSIAAPPSPRVLDNNFTLSSVAGSSPTVHNPYLGFPQSVTPGHLDQILRNTNLNLTTMRSYLDAMRNSLASIPSPTLGNFQRSVGHQGDTLENVEHQEFFKSINPANVGQRNTGLPQSPGYGHTKIHSPKTERNGENGYATLDSCSVITDYLDGPADWGDKKARLSLHTGRGRVCGQSVATDIYPRSAADLDHPESNGINPLGTTCHRISHETRVGQGVRDTLSSTDHVIDNKRHGQCLTSRPQSLAAFGSRHLSAIISSKMHKLDTAMQTDFDSNIAHAASSSPTVHLTGSSNSRDLCHGFKSHQITSSDSRTQKVLAPPLETSTNSKHITEKFASNNLYSVPYPPGATGVFDSISNTSLELQHAQETSHREHSRSLFSPQLGDITENGKTHAIRNSLATDRLGKTGALAGPTAEKGCLTQTDQTHTQRLPDPTVDYDMYSSEPGFVYNTSKAYIKIDQPESVYVHQQTSLSPTSGQFPPLISPFSGGNSQFTPSKNYLVKLFNVLAETPARSANTSHFTGSTRTAQRSQAANTLMLPTRSQQLEKQRPKSLSASFRLPKHVLTAAFHSPARTSDTKPPQEFQLHSRKSQYQSSVLPGTLPGPSLKHLPNHSTADASPNTTVHEVPFQIYRGNPRLLKSSRSFNAHSFPSSTASENRGLRVSGGSMIHALKSNHSVNPASFNGHRGPHAGFIVSEDSPNSEKSQSKHAHFNGHLKPVTDKTKTCTISKTTHQHLPDSPTQGKNRPSPEPSRDFEYMYTSHGWSRVPAMTSVPTVMMCSCTEDNSHRYFEQPGNSLPGKDKSYDNTLDKFIQDLSMKYTIQSDFFRTPLPFTTQVLAGSSKMNKVTTGESSRNDDFSMTTVQRQQVNKLPLYSLLSKKEILYPKAGDFTSEESIASLNTTVSLHNYGERDTSLIPELASPSQCSDIPNVGVASTLASHCCFCRDHVKTTVEDTLQSGHVFMKEAFEQKLNTEAMKIRRIAATRLQTHIRMFLTRRRHSRQKKSALKIQRMVRMWKTRREFQALRNGIILAQAQYRMHSQRRSYLRDREEIQYRLAEQRAARKKQEVHERAEREHRDRQVQMMASVANLDVPGELALVYSKIDEWEFYHSGQHIITAPGDVQSMDMGYKLPVDINSHVFSKYTSVYFKNPNWGVQLEPIKSPITSVHGEVNVSRALAVFKLILRFMCDAHINEKREKILSDFIVQMALKHEGIRDEILCQLANQTWLNQNAERIERTWRLLANCLCCFNPSPSLFKYLLKYVSDVGQSGYNHVCQHKILQSAYMDPLLSRVYPPTFLEWKAIQRKANMALEVRYPDDVNVIGHVESWTSGELFTSHLLKLRGLSENSQGWTLQLQEDVDYYELMGYDYVLDLVSEIEIAPSFPAGTAYLLVSVDRSKERVHHRRHGHAEGPHNPEKERILLLSGPLPELLKRDIPVTSPSETGLQNLSGSRKNKVIGMEDDLGFSMTSVLNQRPTEILPAGLSENSKMNLRYTKRSKAPAVPATNGHVPNGIGNGNDYADDDDDDPDLSDLSKNILNTRYFPNGFKVDTKDLSSSKLNHRYNKKSKQQNRISTAGVSAQVTRRVSSREEFQSANSDNTDWSHLVEDIFSNALDEHDEQDGRILGSRIKGGGQGIPGLQTQQPMSQPMSFNYGITTPILGVGQPIMPPLTSPTGLPSVGLVNTGIIGDPLQQITAQHLAQQQAVLQSYLAQQQQQQQQQQVQQAVLAQQQAQALQVQQQQALQAQQQQAQQAVLAQQQAQALQAQQQQALQAQQQQAQKVMLAQQQQASAALKVALQEQELQNKFLKQSIEQEALKQQLRQIQAYQDVTPVVPLPPVVPLARTVPVVQPVPVMAQYTSLSPNSSFSGSHLTMAASSVGVRGNTVTVTSVPPPPPLPPAAAPASPPPPPPPTASYINGIGQAKITSTQPSPLKKVSFIQSQQEETDLQKPKVPPPTAPKQPRTNLQFQLPKSMNPTSGMIRTLKVTSTSTVDAVHRPPTPPPPVPTNFEHVPPLHTQPAVPPAPPPPPPPAPPAIEIDKDRGTFTIRDRTGRARTVRIGKVVWPPPIERQEKYDIQVGKLEIDEQVERNLENRISGKKKWQKPEPPEQEETRPKSIIKNNEKTTRSTSVIANSHKETIEKLEKHFTAVSPAVVSPTVPKPLKHFVSESTETENQYAMTIEKDEPLPPPIPKSEPPKIVKKTITETTEIVEIKRASGDYAARIEPDPVVKRYEPIAPIQAIQAIQAIQPKEVETQKMQVDYAAFERVITELYPQNKKFFLMYNKVPWTLHIRKEVFWPSEKLENQMALHLIYCQIVEDVYNNGCVRITKDQRIKMKGLLEGHGISQQNYLTKELKPQVKKVIVDTAKEWPVYFCRLFPIAASGHYSGVRYLGVSHTGLRLVTRERTFVDDHLSVIEDIRFEDVVNVVLPTSSTVQLNLRTKSLIFHTTRAQQLKDMIDRFCQESDKGNKYVVAVKDYITRESTLLSFKRGDIIKLMEPEMNLERGWMYGSLNGTVGLFPAEYVKSLARHEVETLNNKPVLYQSKMTNGLSLGVTDAVSNGVTNGVNVRDSRSPDDNSDTSQGTVVADGKYSMMEYAMLNFRESLDKYEMLRTEDGSIRGTVKMIETAKLQNLNNRERSKQGGADWTWKEQADLVKWTRSPIQASLLKFNASDLNKLALECFIAIMRFMGDYPMGPDMTEYDCAKKILKACHKYPLIRDEIFCQLCKQTTNNRSMFSKSKIRGWRLFGLVAAYFDCSDSLRPYLFKYLETAASDSSRTYNNAAGLCLTNLRKTFKYGGRKDVPLREEVVALADGRTSKRFPFFYSGGDTHEGMLQVKSCTVVHDAIEEVCAGLNITDPVEMEEYTFFIRTRDGTFTKLNREDYLLDETAYYIRKQILYDLIFQRTVWYFPLRHMDQEIFVDMMFHQCVLDYIEGFMVTLPGNKLTRETASDVAYLGAVLLKANKMVGTPTLKDLDSLVPRNVRQLPDPKPQQWLNRIHENLEAAARMTTLEAKSRFVDVLKRWPLFGSTFFLIKSIPNVGGETMLAVNRQGIVFLRKNSHETFMERPFSEILSTRRYHGDNNINYLDMKLGDLMVQQILRIETDQGSDISDLIGQYMQVINRHRKLQDRPSPNAHR